MTSQGLFTAFPGPTSICRRNVSDRALNNISNNDLLISMFTGNGPGSVGNQIRLWDVSRSLGHD